MKMYKIQRTSKNTRGNPIGHRYRTTWGRFLKSFEVEANHGEKIGLYEKTEASFLNKNLRSIDRDHRYKMVLADNV